MAKKDYLQCIPAHILSKIYDQACGIVNLRTPSEADEVIIYSDRQIHLLDVTGSVIQGAFWKGLFEKMYLRIHLWDKDARAMDHSPEDSWVQVSIGYGWTMARGGWNGGDSPYYFYINVDTGEIAESDLPDWVYEARKKKEVV